MSFIRDMAEALHPVCAIWGHDFTEYETRIICDRCGKSTTK